MDYEDIDIRGYEIADRFRVVARTYGNLANVYTNIVFEDHEKTVVQVYFEDEGERFKHFTFVLGTGKTRVTMPDLTVGKYVVDVTQFGDGEMEKASTFFFIKSPGYGGPAARSRTLINHRITQVLQTLFVVAAVRCYASFLYIRKADPPPPGI